MITVAETKAFQRKIEGLLSDQENEDLVYYFHSEDMPLYLLAAFGKNEKANLSMQERNILAKAVKELVAIWRRRNGKGFH